ncbi:MAG TPA: DUF1800 domain-containing protein [Terriglobales bacterium]|nr:DUF1800 domain-containing protein [Terriglobales bacterium]
MISSKRRGFLPLPSPQGVLAVSLSLALCLPFGFESPLISAEPIPAAREKKPKKDPALKGLPITELTEDEAILHALNRLAYGPRPGDVERVKQMGLANWIEQQLNPNSINDSAMEARLQDYPTLKMSSAKLIAEYPQQKQALKREERRQAQLAPADSAAAVVARDMRADHNAASGSEEATEASANSNSAAPDADTPSPMKQDPEMENPPTRGVGRRGALGIEPDNVPRAIADNSHRPQRVIAELAMAKMIRAIYSERQLQQVMDDFWFNHFNVYAAKGADKWLLTSYERDTIQPHTLGKFRDLLEATAKSPAMLFYLDNYLSADPNAAKRMEQERMMRQQMRAWRLGLPYPQQNPQAQKKQQMVRGLNENYGRELMELHTLGVDGGYTQKDVTEVARCFTGWSIEKPREEAKFVFRDQLHDPGTKVVLGKKIHAGGMKDGEEVLNLLARHPSTATFISTELGRRFVSDNPPPALVDRMAKTFLSTDGDIRSVMRTMIYSPEFWSRGAYNAKIKTPFELVVSAARALGTDVDTPLPMVMWTARIGEPLYQCQPPTGYSDKADAWVNTGALLNRMNYSLALSENRMRGSHSDVASLLGLDSTTDPKAALDRAVQIFLDGQVAESTVQTLDKQLENPQILQARLDDPVKQVNLGVIAGLVLGAPEFQRR